MNRLPGPVQPQPLRQRQQRPDSHHNNVNKSSVLNSLLKISVKNIKINKNWDYKKMKRKRTCIGK